VQRLIREGKITLSKRIDEGGTYNVTIPYVPASVATLLSQGNQIAKFVVTPDPITSKTLCNLITSDPNIQKTIEMHLLEILQMLAYDFETKGKGGTTYHYFSDSRISVLMLTIPEKVASLLTFPERIIEYTRGSFDDLIRSFLENSAFVQGTNPTFGFRALRYDPKSKDLLPLSRLEIKEKACHMLELLRNS
jgi:hypothetical protein